MAAIYAAEIYCDDCADLIRQQIKDKLIARGMTEEEIADKFCDERDYDSEEYPKWVDDDDERDSPQHCGSCEECVNGEMMPSGHKIGCLIGTNLTSDGIQYVKDKVAEGGEVADFWRERFCWIDFPPSNEDEDEPKP